MKYPAVFAALALTCASQFSFAAEVSDSEIQLLREQIRLLSERLDQLEQSSLSNANSANQAANQATRTDNTLATNTNAQATDEELDRKIEQAVDERVSERMASVSWAERMRWSGDFRYRYENIAVEGKDDRNRNRIRARAYLSADISDTVQVGLGLATGGEDPVSTNQTIGGGGSSKPLSVDLAYFEWTGLKNTTVVGGKFKQQQHSAGDFGLLWDSDWRPEGTSIKYDNGMLYAVALGTWIESDSNKSQQEFSFGLQAGLNFPLGDALALNIGAGYYQFDAAGKNSFFGDGDFYGNSFNPVTNTYLYDYHELEAYAELSFDLLERPMMIFADYVQNTDAPENDTGYAFGINYSEAKKKGSWELNYAYKKLEADAVLGLLTDSDFGGGGTNNKGSVLSGAYAMDDNWNFRMTYFLNQTSIDSMDPRDFDRLMLDLQFKYK
jgi:hypothetical protein